MADAPNHPMTIRLKPSDGAMTKLFPLVQSCEVKWEQLNHLARAESQRIERTFEPMTVDLVAPTTLYQSHTEALSRMFAQAKVEQALEDELAACIPLFASMRCTVAARPKAANHEPQSHGVTTWADKIQALPQGSAALYHDLTLLYAQLRAQMGVSLTHRSNHLTLVVPADQLPYLQTKTSCYESALSLFQEFVPEVEIVTVPRLNDQQSQPCVLLLCTSEVCGPVGYTVLEQQVRLKQTELSEGYRFQLIIPEHRLVIVNPEQLAVLTGI